MTDEEINNKFKALDKQINALRRECVKSNDLKADLKIITGQMKLMNDRFEEEKTETKKKFDDIGDKIDKQSEAITNLSIAPYTKHEHIRDIVITASITAIIGGVIGYFISYLFQVFGG